MVLVRVMLGEPVLEITGKVGRRAGRLEKEE